MAVKHCFVPLLLSLLLASVSCSRHNYIRKSTESQYERLGNECDLNKLDAVQPDNRVESEAGVTETWNPNHEQFQCAGVAVQRHTIQSQGLLLPSYANAPQLIYIIKGRGLTGVLFSGCPETFQESQGSQERIEGGRFQDQHQRIRRFREGDIIAIPAGVAHWCYNDGNEEVVAVNFLHTNSFTNQLDISPRNFYLAGNPRQEFPKQQSAEQGQEWRHEQQGSCNNLFCGMEPRLIAEAFNVDEQTARKLQSEGDYRGNIVRVESLQVVKPPRVEEERAEQEREGRPSHRTVNGLEETMCSMRIKENIGDRETADYYVPEAGWFSLVNKFNLPILDFIGLSAQRGSLYNEALFLPHWHKSAHSILYGIRGEARVQIVDHNGRKLYDGTLGENQVLTIPQNYAAVLRAQSERFEWVSFNTHSHNDFQPLAGRTSVIRALPEEVVANMYQVSLEDAWRIKFNTPETLLRSPRRHSGRRSVA